MLESFFVLQLLHAPEHTPDYRTISGAYRKGSLLYTTSVELTYAAVTSGPG